MSMDMKKIGKISGVVLLVLCIGFGGGMIMGRLMVVEDVQIVEKGGDARSYPLCDLGEFKIALSGSKYVEGRLVSFEPILELENEKVAETLNSEEYWRALFRNEVLSEVMSHSVEAFRTPEGMLDLSAAIASRLNAVVPTFATAKVPIRRVLFKSFIMQ